MWAAIKHKLKKVLYERLVGRDRLDQEEFDGLVGRVAKKTAQAHAENVLRSNHGYMLQCLERV